MSRQFRLTLPSDMEKLVNQREHLKEYDGKPVRRTNPLLEGNWEITPVNYTYPIFKVKKEWLEELYPCADCGLLRTKDEGGITFTICDKCWDKRHKKESLSKSAFQEWDDSEPVDPNPIHNDNWHRRRERKEGWNAALDVLKKEILESVMKHIDNKILIERINKLKEL